MSGVIGALFKSHIRIEGFRVVTRWQSNTLERTGDAAAKPSEQGDRGTGERFLMN